MKIDAMTEKSQNKPATHRCSQTKQIAKLNLLLLGNGNIKEGAIYKMIDMASSIESLCTDVAEIKTKLSTQAEINTELEIQNRVKAELKAKAEEKFKADEAAVKIKQSWRGLSLQTISVAGGIAIIIITLIFQLLNYNLSRQAKKTGIETENKIDNLGTPVLSNPRGLKIYPSDSLGVKFWPKDFIDDSL